MRPTWSRESGAADRTVPTVPVLVFDDVAEFVVDEVMSGLEAPACRWDGRSSRGAAPRRQRA